MSQADYPFNPADYMMPYDYSMIAKLVPDHVIRRPIDDFTNAEYCAQMNARNKACERARLFYGDNAQKPDLDVYDYLHAIPYQVIYDRNVALGYVMTGSPLFAYTPTSLASAFQDAEFAQALGLEQYRSLSLKYGRRAFHDWELYGWNKHTSGANYNVPPLEVNDRGQAFDVFPPQTYPAPIHYENIPTMIVTNPEGELCQIVVAPSNIPTPRYISEDDRLRMWCHFDLDYDPVTMAGPSPIGASSIVEPSSTSTAKVESKKRRREDEDQEEGRRVVKRTC